MTGSLRETVTDGRVKRRGGTRHLRDRTAGIFPLVDQPPDHLIVRLSRVHLEAVEAFLQLAGYFDRRCGGRHYTVVYHGIPYSLSARP